MGKVNDKGFSLIELIIVVAIMAALIMIITPQFLKYVEKSRNATDLQNARAVADAIEIYATNPDSGLPPPDYWQAVTAFAADDTEDRPEKCMGAPMGEP